MHVEFPSETFPHPVKFAPAYSGGVMFTQGIGIPEPVTVGEETYPAGSQLPVVVDLSTVQLEQNIPILYNHDAGIRLGHTEKIETDGATLTAEGLLESPGQWTKEILDSAKAGAKWQCSIGSGLIEVQNKSLVKAGETVTVNGQTLAGPFTLLTHLRVREISIVPAGADPATETLLASFQPTRKGTDMNFETWASSMGFDLTALNEANIAALKAIYEGKDAAAPQAPESVQAECAEDEKETVQADASPDSEDEKETPAGGVLNADASTENADEDEKNPEAVQAAAFPHAISPSARSLNVPSRSAGNASADRIPSRSEVLQASALLMLGIPHEWLADARKGGFSRRAIDLADREQQYMGLQSLMGEMLQACGIPVDYRNPHKLVDDFNGLFTRGQSLQASAVSSKNFGEINVFSPVIDKQMRYKYDRLDSIWKKLYRERKVRDFKEVATVDFDVVGKGKTLLEHEDYPTVQLQSSGEKFKVSKNGVVAAISFESQVNDDMGALDVLGDELVNMLYDIQIDEFWKQFWALNSTAFTTGKGNKITRSLSIEGLTLAKKAFGSLKNANGLFLHVPPKFLLVPLALEDPALSLFQWQWAGENNTKGNIHKGKYEVITDPYLGSEGGYSGATDTGWFMCGDTSRYPLGEYAVLAGFETPRIKETWYDHKDGLNMRAMGTIGFHGYTDKLCAVYSTGTANS